MGSFVCRQPNGKLCRFSTVVDSVTHYNMTDDEYIEMCAERAREEARYIIESGLKSYNLIDKYFRPGNMTQEEFDKIKKEMEVRDDSNV